MGFLHFIFNPAIVALMIPIVAIIANNVYKTTKLRLEHEERMARIEAGMDPDDFSY